MATSQPNIAVLLLLAAGAVLSFLWTSRQWKKGRGGGTAAGRSVLETYTQDLTREAENGKLDVVIGREEEIERIIHILSRRLKNNPLLLGEPGVGKTAVVEGIARHIVAGTVPDTMKGKRILALDLGALIGGTKYRGEFEERMKALTKEITDQARRIILFIDEIHMIAQTKGAEGALNVSDIIKPALARGDLQLIGATTWREYEQYIKEDDALNRRLQPVIVGEPSPEAAVQILHGIKDVYEAHHHVQYTDGALQAAVILSKKYIGDRFLPDKAIDLIDEAGAKVSIEASHAARHAMGLLHAAGAEQSSKLEQLEKEKKDLEQELAHVKKLESELHGEPEVGEIRARLEHLLASLQRVRQGVGGGKAGPPKVDTAEIREIVAEWVGKPLSEIV